MMDAVPALALTSNSVQMKLKVDTYTPSVPPLGYYRPIGFFLPPSVVHQVMSCKWITVKRCWWTLSSSSSRGHRERESCQQQFTGYFNWSWMADSAWTSRWTDGVPERQNWGDIATGHMCAPCHQTFSESIMKAAKWGRWKEGGKEEKEKWNLMGFCIDYWTEDFK